MKTGEFIRTAGWFEAVLKYAARRELPMPSTDRWCAFNEQRRATALREQQWDAAAGVLRVTLEAQSGLPGGTLLLPARYQGREIAEVTLDGRPLPLARRSVLGTACALAAADFGMGASAVEVRYR